MHALTPAAWLTLAPGCCAPGEFAHLHPQSTGEQSLRQREPEPGQLTGAEKLLLHCGAAASAALWMALLEEAVAGRPVAWWHLTPAQSGGLNSGA